MKIIDCIQGSPEWFEAHRGIPTASNFDRILTAKTMKLSAQADKFIAELIGQIFTIGSIEPKGYISRPMQDGILMEPEARRWYEFERNCEVRQVGMCLTDDGHFGASPDALVGEDGALELKCPLAATHVQYLLDGVLPSEYAAQVHGELIVTGREYVDFVSYCPGLPGFIVRQTPNAYTESLRKALDEFWTRYQVTLAKVRGIGSALAVEAK